MMLSKVSEASKYNEAINTNTNACAVKQAIGGLLIAALTAFARNDGFQVLLEESNIPKLGEKL